MSAIILKILEKHPDKIFTQTELIEKIKEETGEEKSKSAISQNCKTLIKKNKITYIKGKGRKPAQISLKKFSISLETTPKPIEEPKPKPIEEPKPKPILNKKPKPKPKPIVKGLPIEAETTLKTTFSIDDEEIIDEDYPDSSDKEYMESNIDVTETKFVTEPKDKHAKDYIINPELLNIQEPLRIAKKTVINQQEEITELQQEINNLKGIWKKNFSFNDFSDFILSKVTKTGSKKSNSLKIGEIACRRSSLKNIYLIILMLRDNNLI